MSDGHAQCVAGLGKYAQAELANLRLWGTNHYEVVYVMENVGGPSGSRDPLQGVGYCREDKRCRAEPKRNRAVHKEAALPSHAEEVAVLRMDG